MNYSRQENHRVYLQRYLPPASSGLSAFSSSSQNKDGDGHRLVTSSAAIRLTDAATAENVTCLLRKKFGLSSPLDSSAESLSSSSSSASSSSKQERTGKTKQKKKRKKEKEHYRYFSGDALILVGTLHNLPRQHLEFDHEERNHMRMNLRKPIPAKKQYGDLSSTASTVTMASNSTLYSESNLYQHEATMQYPNNYHKTEIQTEEKAENINVIRTLLPYENPLRVRDEMLVHLFKRQHEYDSDNLITKPIQNNGINKENQSHQRLKKVEQMLQRQRNKKDDLNSKNKKRNTVNVSTRWFFQPNGGGKFDLSDPNAGSNINPTITPNVLNLDGYISAPEDSSSDEDESDTENELVFINPHKNGIDSSLKTNNQSPALDSMQHQAWNSETYYYNRFGTAPHISYTASQTDSPHNSTNQNMTYHSCIHDMISPSIPLHNHDPFFSGASHSQKYLWKEMKNRSILAKMQSPTSNSHCISGYLLKRSIHDPNVWRKVFCTLTDDQFWFVTRIKPVPTSPRTPENSHSIQYTHTNTKMRTAKHHMVQLSRANVREPKVTDPQPKSRLSLSGPTHLIHISSDDGKIHVFCAPHRKAQLYWIKAISSRIATCLENKLMEFAELIVEEEEDARTHRMEENSLMDCWHRINTQCIVNDLDTGTFDEHIPCSDDDVDIKDNSENAVIAEQSIADAEPHDKSNGRENDDTANDDFDAEKSSNEYMDANTDISYIHDNYSILLQGENWYHNQSIAGNKWWWKELVRLSMLVQEYREVCRHFISFGRFFEGDLEQMNVKEVEKWRFNIRVQWEAAATVCLSKCYSNISLSGNARDGNVFYHDDGGQLGEIGASIEAFVYDHLRKLNSKYAKEIVMVEAPPIDLFDSIMQKILKLDECENDEEESFEERHDMLEDVNGI